MDKAVRGHPYAKMAVDAVILDLVAQNSGIPVYELLGGQHRTEIPITHSISLLLVVEAVTEALAVTVESVLAI